MVPDPFPGLPDDSRLWVLALSQPAVGEAAARLEEGLGALLGRWRHKGQAYAAAWELREGRLILVVEPSMATAPSGCAIDGMLRKVRGLAQELGFELLGEDRVLVRQDGQIASVPRTDLAQALEEGRLGPDTPVLDLALHHLGQLREGRLERPLARTWIGRVFKVAATSPS
jgi:hypothetical protein